HLCSKAIYRKGIRGEFRHNSCVWTARFCNCSIRSSSRISRISEFRLEHSAMALCGTRHPARSNVIGGNRIMSKISIVTPSLNQAAYLDETLESIRSQNYADVEHLVLDG